MDKDIFAFSATETGYNHLKINKVCEDASDFYDDEKMHICVVADGHGSDNYPRTDKGSKFAVDAAIRCIIEFVENADSRQVLDDERNNYVLLTQLAKSILREWYQAIEDDYIKYPFGPNELEKVSEKYKKRYLATCESERIIEKAYGCTLIAFAVTEYYSFGIQIGDGKCVFIDRYGSFSEPIPWDENCQLNITTSICDSDAIEEFRFCVSDQIPTAVFCGSDGIDDSYASSQEVYALYRSILNIFTEHGIETGKNEIKGYLPVLTKKGSGDDVSIGTIIDYSHAIDIAPLMEIQSQLFRVETECEQKKQELYRTGEKEEALWRKLKNLRSSNEFLAETAMKIDNLKRTKEQLQIEIQDQEKEIAELRTKQQDMIFEREVASFEDVQDENIKSEIVEEAGSLEEKEDIGQELPISDENNMEKTDTISDDTGKEKEEVANESDDSINNSVNEAEELVEKNSIETDFEVEKDNNIFNTQHDTVDFSEDIGSDQSSHINSLDIKNEWVNSEDLMKKDDINQES